MTSSASSRIFSPIFATPPANKLVVYDLAGGFFLRSSIVAINRAKMCVSSATTVSQGRCYDSREGSFGQRENEWYLFAPMDDLLANAWYLTGPTAAGKTAVAIELARRIGAEIISLDSMAIYRSMDIGTAKPTQAERKEIPHHLIDLLEPSEEFSVAHYLE